MLKSIWRSAAALFAVAAIASPAACQVSQKVVFLRAMSRAGKRVYFAAESVDLKSIRRFELANTAKVRLFFPRPPYGHLEQRYVTQKRFLDLFMRKDKKQPQPASFKSPFVITVKNQTITSIAQRP